MSTSPFESETTPEEYRQRALLFADLGRYDEAAAEIAAGLAAAPDDAGLLTTLARVHIAAEQPVEALVAADRAVAAAPGEIAGMVVRAMALTDDRRYGEAAAVAGEILRRWPADPYAQRTGAALLSESRNGQDALNAAWQSVKVAETDPESHLVLAMVAARLRLFDLAQQAYARALDLDETIGDAQQDVGVVRLERRRWAAALESLADEALGAPAAEPPPREPVVEREAEPEQPQSDPEPADDAARATVRNEPPPVARPAAPVLDRSRDKVDAVRQAVRYGAGSVLVAALLTGLMTTASEGAARVWAGMVGVIIFVAVLVWLARRLAESPVAVLNRLPGADRKLAIAAYLTFVAPLIVLAYAVIGGLVPLIVALVVAAAAEVLAVGRR